MAFPPGALEDKDDGGKLAAIVIAFVACLAAYHAELAREGSRPGSLDEGGKERERRRSGRRKAKVNFWDSISALDLRYGSHVGLVSRRGLGLFRAAATLYCAGMWALYVQGSGCCEELRLFEVWSFALQTLLFALGLVVSIKQAGDGAQLRLWERAFVVLLEIELPTTAFCFCLYWRFLRDDPSVAFPSTESRWVNDLFVCSNLVLVLLEVSLDRVVLSSRRWMFFAYFSSLYTLFVICFEKLHGEEYVVYKGGEFLRLSVHAFPNIVELMLVQFACHYIGCAFVSLRQRFWTLPITHPIQGAMPSAEPSPGGDYHPLPAGPGATDT